MDSQIVQNLLQFLRQHTIAMIATIREGKAHGATVFYHVENDLQFYFLTKDKTSKYNNLIADTSVGLVISDLITLETVQVEGIAKEVDYTKDPYDKIMKTFINDLSKQGQQWEAFPINHLRDGGYYTCIQVVPKWIRWSDFHNWSHTIKLEHRF